MDQQVAALLQDTLSAAASTRIQAELSLKELHTAGGEQASIEELHLPSYSRYIYHHRSSSESRSHLSGSERRRLSPPKRWHQFEEVCSRALVGSF